MKQINLKEMYDAGVHLGCSVKNLNPKMKPYIMCTHDGIAIIDILKTYTRLFRITLFLKKVIATEGYRVLFVGTQKSIAPLISEIATKSSSYYVNERWKGGFLTNFKTMKGNTPYNDKGSTGESLYGNHGSRILSPRSSEKGHLEKTYDSKNSSFNPQQLKAYDASKGLNSNYNQPVKVSSKKNENDNTQLFESNILTSLPDLVIIVGQEKELKAIKECQKLNIPTITILDSDGDPEKTSLFIPANDDSRSSVEFILKHLGQSILVGRLLYDKKNAKATPLTR